MSQALGQAFRQLNQQITDQQRWEAEHALQRENVAIEKLRVQSLIEDKAMQRKQLELSMQGQKIQNRLNEMKLKEHEDYVTPREWSIYPLMGREILDNPEQEAEAKKLFTHLSGGADVSFSPADGRIMFGKRAGKFAPEQMESILPMLERVRSGWDNSPLKAKQRYEVLSDGLTKVRANLKKIQNSNNHPAVKRKELGIAQAAEQQILDDLKTLEPMTTDDYALEYYEKRGSQYLQDAIWARTNLSDEAADFLIGRSQHYDKLYRDHQESILKGSSGKKLKLHTFRDQATGKVLGQFQAPDGSDLSEYMEAAPEGAVLDVIPKAFNQVDQTLNTTQVSNAVERRFEGQTKGILGPLKLQDFQPLVVSQIDMVGQYADRMPLSNPKSNEIAERRTHAVMKDAYRTHNEEMKRVYAMKAEEFYKDVQTKPEYEQFKADVKATGQTLSPNNVTMLYEEWYTAMKWPMEATTKLLEDMEKSGADFTGVTEEEINRMISTWQQPSEYTDTAYLGIKPEIED